MRAGALRDRWNLVGLASLVLLGIAVATSSSASPLLHATTPRVLTLAVAVAVGSIVRRRRIGRGPTELLFLVGGLVVAFLHLDDSNEMAGILTLLVPFAVVRVLFPDRNLFIPRVFRRWTALALAVVLAGLLLRSGSRGGLLGCLVAVAVVLSLAGGRGRRLLLWGALAVLGVAMVVGPHRLAGFWFYGGDLSLPAQKLLTGRPEIWLRTLRALADAPMTGYGLGTFDPIIGTIYPTAHVRGSFEDAHNLFLDTSFSLGLPGFLALLGLLTVAFRRLGAPAFRRPLRQAEPALLAAPASRRHAGVSAALLASLLAHVLYSLTDAVALGTTGNLAFWYLLGMIFALPVRSPYRRPLRLRRWIVPVLTTLLLVLYLLMPLRINYYSVMAVRAILGHGDVLEARDELVHLETCRAWWLVGLLDQAGGDIEGRDASWARYLECSDDVPALVPAVVPDHTDLSRLALRLHPGDPTAYFWHARTLPQTDRAVIRLYRRGLLLEPSNGLAWIALGDRLAVRNPVAALGAYVEGCRHGDPGLNGCWRAGQTAEKLGDIESAVRYYRHSRWERALARADELESR